MGNDNLGATTSGIKVLDRAISIMIAVAQRPLTLAELAETTNLPRATAHRLATALEVHQIVARTPDGRWTTGSALAAMGAGAASTLVDAALPFMTALMDAAGESVQLYQRAGDSRVCIAALEPSSGLQNVVPVGSRLPLSAGSAAQVFVAFSDSLQESVLLGAVFSADTLVDVRARGYALSDGERESGLASVSAPVFDAQHAVLGVLSVSGPAQRIHSEHMQQWLPMLLDAAKQLSTLVQE